MNTLGLVGNDQLMATPCTRGEDGPSPLGL